MEVEGRAELEAVLSEARARGLVGPGPVGAHLEHTRAWAEVLGGSSGAGPERFLDLGTGGGVPGLLLARWWPDTRAVLLDSRRRALDWVRTAAARLGVEDRVELVEARAEDAARDPRWREVFPLVVARGFAAPAVTAECGGAFVEVGGRLSVSEPPGGAAGAEGGDRWPAAGLDRLGLAVERRVDGGGASFVVLTRTGAVPGEFPRAVGKPARRPLWG